MAKMKFMTKAILKKFEQVGRQENVEDPIVVCKFFNPTGAGTWYATEYDPETRTFFGFVSLFGDWNDEWGYFSEIELRTFRGRFGLGIERDLHFKSQPFSKIGIKTGIYA